MRRWIGTPLTRVGLVALALTGWTCSDAAAPRAPVVDGPLMARAKNRPPVADAGGPYVAGVGMSVRLDGRRSTDPDGPSSKLKYAWRFGDGTTGTGATPSHAYAQLGTYTVILVVTDAKGGVSAPDTTHVSIETNADPLAHAGGPYAGTAGAAVTFDGSASTDPDLRLPLTYAWRFGDGSSGSGATPQHVYASAGTYEVILVVTDAWGAASAPDTTAAVIAANEIPVAAPGGPYAGTAGVPMQFDGSGSTDPDGHLPLSYQWNFGDGASGSGMSPSHTFASAGTYTVTLTVTDALGAASVAATTSATVAAPTGTWTDLVRDTFSRTLSGGWGTADVGGLWHIDGSVLSSFSTDGSRGLIIAPSASPRNVIATDGYGLDVTGLVSFSIDRMPDNPGRFYTVQVYARRNDLVSDGDNYYRFRVRAFGTGAMDLRVQKNVNAVSAWLATGTSIPTTWVPGQRYWIRWECMGASPSTALRMRVWADGAPEPTTWQLDLTTSEPGLDVPGTTGIRVEGPNADQVNFPITFSFDDLRYSGRN